MKLIRVTGHMLNHRAKPGAVARRRAGIAARAACAGAAVLAVMGASDARAQQVDWLNTTGDSRWGTAANWAGGALPAASANLRFSTDAGSSAQTIDLGATTRTAGMIFFDTRAPQSTFTNGTLTCDSLTLSVGTDVVVSGPLRAASTLLSIDTHVVAVDPRPRIAATGLVTAENVAFSGFGELTLGAAQAVTSNQISGALIVRGTRAYNGQVQGIANPATGANPFGTASISLQGGVLFADASSSFMFGNAISVSRESTLAVRRSGTATFGGLALSDTTLRIQGVNATPNGTADVTFAQPSTLAGNATLLVGDAFDGLQPVGGAARVHFAAPIAGTGSLTTAGYNGEVLLETANTYTGGTFVGATPFTNNQSSVVAIVAGALSTGPVVVQAGGRLKLAAPNAGASRIDVKSGNLDYDVAGAAGGNLIVAAGTGRVGQPGSNGPTQLTQFYLRDVGQINLGPAITSVGSDRFVVGPGHLIAGDAARLGLLNRARFPGEQGNVELAPGAIVVHQSTGAGTIADLGTAADLVYGVGSDNARQLTIGVGTPWRGVSTGRDTDAVLIGTLNATGDFTIGGVPLIEGSNATAGLKGGGGPQLALGRVSGATVSALNVVSAVPVNALVTGSASVRAGSYAGVTFRVRDGGLLSFKSLFNSNGAVAEAGGVIGIYPGDANSPTEIGNVVDRPVTINPGGILSLDGAVVPQGTGQLTLMPGSIIDLHRGNQLSGSWITPQSIPAGAVVRLRNTRSFSVNGFQNLGDVTPGAIFQIIEPSAGITGAGDVTLNGHHLTNSNAANYTEIGIPPLTAGDVVLGPNGASISASTGTGFFMNESISGAGRPLTVGAAQPLAGEPKGGNCTFTGTVNAGSIRVASGSATFSGSPITADSLSVATGAGAVAFASTTSLGAVDIDPGAGPVSFTVSTGFTGTNTTPNDVPVKGRLTVGAGSTAHFGFDHAIGSVAGSGTIVAEKNLWIGMDRAGSTFSGTFGGQGRVVYGSNNTFNFAGVGENKGGLLIAGSNGTVTLLPGSQGFRGGIFVSANLAPGILSISADNQLGDLANPIQLRGGRLRATESMTLRHPLDIITSASAIETLAGVTLAVDVPITSANGTGQLTKIGAGALKLSARSTYVGTVVSEGQLQFGVRDALPAGTYITASSGALVDTLGFSQRIGRLTGSGAVRLSGQSVLEIGAVGTSGFNSTYSGTFDGTGTLAKAGPGTLTLDASSSLANTGGLFVGGGTAVLAGSSTLDGGLTVGLLEASAGTLQVDADHRMGLPSNVVTLAGGTLRPTASFTSPRRFTFGNGTGNADGVIDVPSSDMTFTLTGPLDGINGLAKAGPGTVEVRSAAAYGGGTTVRGGTLRLAGADGRLPGRSNVLLATGATLDLGPNVQVVGSLSGTGGAVSVGGEMRLGGTNTVTEFAGTVGGAGRVTKTGDGVSTLAGAVSVSNGVRVEQGTLVLNSPANAFTGGVDIAGGTLVVPADVAMGGPSNSVSLSGGGTLRVSADGANSRAFDVGGASGSAGVFDVAPGRVYTLTGTLTGSGTLTKSGSGTLTVATPAGQSFAGQLRVTPGGGRMTLAGDATLTSATGLLVGNGVAFDLDETAGDRDRLADAMDVQLEGGTLRLLTPAAGPVMEDLGDLLAGPGSSTLTFGGGGGTLRFDSLVRTAGGGGLSFEPPGLSIRGSRLDVAVPSGATLGIDYRVLVDAPLPSGFGSWLTVNGGQSSAYVPGYGIVAAGFVAPAGGGGAVPEPAAPGVVAVGLSITASTTGRRRRRRCSPR